MHSQRKNRNNPGADDITYELLKYDEEILYDAIT